MRSGLPSLKETRYYTREQADRFLGAAESFGLYWYSLFFVALRTGICEGEIFCAQTCHVDLGGHGRPAKFHVRQQVQRGEVGEPKWGRSRSVDLDADTVRVMSAYLEWHKERFPCCLWLFPG